ncbi:MAG TPA: pyruvate kinase [Tepidisphaeraceae bacterium]|jgi:pyruvate kinase|nr:pyruvate kinase [Tepidisphaeraceae bacterium]
MIRTKIVATMGPAVATAETLLSLFQAGADVCRLNFSHGSLDEHLAMLRIIREAAARHDQPIAILGDLCGPKIRLGKIADHASTGGMPVNVGDEIILQREAITGENGRVSCILPTLIDDIRVGDRLLVEDGLIRFVCTDKNFNELKLSCTTGGILKSSKGINLPSTPLNVQSITDRDWECVDWAIDNNLDYLALSFVRRPDELILLRDHLRHHSSDIQLIAKIEKAEAVKDIDPIIDAADGLMVARGDLGVEMDAAQVPIIQKDLIRRCQSAGKPVIVATQMLQSMIEQASPTRAEVSDVANAIFDGTDAVMLSGETSVGKFPIAAVHIMNHIAGTTEEYLVSQLTPTSAPPLRLKTMSLSSSLAKGVWQIVQDLKPRVVVIWSQNGTTARIFSKARFPVPVIALSSDHCTLRRMALHYGITPREMAPPGNFVELATQIDAMLREQKFAADGDRALIVAGASMGTPGTQDGIIVHTVGQQWTETHSSAQSPETAIIPEKQ